MRLGKYLSSLNKPEIDKLKENCNLSDEEQMVFILLSEGKSTTEISMRMGISVSTVKRRIRSVNNKMADFDKLNKVPIWQKMNLTVEEAAEYSNIGICKINDMAKDPKCPFVLYVGRKKLIKRKEFEKYISNVLEV